MYTFTHQKTISLAEDSIIRPAPGDPNADADSPQIYESTRESELRTQNPRCA
jgi:hypothetical protein